MLPCGQRVILNVLAADAAAPSSTAPVFYVTVHEVPRQRPVTPDQQAFRSSAGTRTTKRESPSFSVTEGSLVRVRLRITVPADRQFVALTDPLPAGLEAWT